MNDTADEKKKIYQTCRFCGGEFGTRGIKNHEIKCEKLHTTPAELPAEQPVNETTEPPKLKPLTPLKPITQEHKPQEAETTEEIKTISGDAIKIIKNAAPKIDPNAPLAAESGNSLSDIMKQAEMVGKVNEIVNTDGVQTALKGVGNLLEAAAEKLRGGVTKTATGTAKSPEEDFLEKFAQGLV